MTMQQVSKGEFDRRVKLLEQKVNESANKLMSDYKEFIERINSVVSENPDFNKYAAIVDRINSCFDTNGQFDGSHIAPLSIETAALSVGQRSQQLTLKNVKFVVDNYGDVSSQNQTQENNPRTNYGVLKVVNDNGNTTGTYGELTHFTLFDEDDNGTIKPTVATFRLEYNNSITIDDNALHYVYAKLPCNKVNNVYLYEELSGTPITPISSIEISTQQYKIDDNYRDNNKFLYVLLGTISKELIDSNSDLNHKYYRIVDLNYGLTTINGRLITTGRIEGSTQNGAYFDLDKGEIGGTIKFTENNTSTLLNELGFASQTYVGNSINNIEIGGRNYLLGVTNKNGSPITNGATYTCPDNKTIVLKCTTANSYAQAYYQTMIPNYNDLAGKEVVFSIDKVIKSNNNCIPRVYLYSNDGGISIRMYDNQTFTDKYIYKFTFPSIPNGTTMVGLIIRGSQNVISVNDTVTFIGLKLELGNKATDWTPAPEDMEESGWINKKHTIYYSSISTNKPSANPDPPSTSNGPVTETTSSDYNVWTKVIPSVGNWYFSCDQLWKEKDGTTKDVVNTDVIFDETITSNATAMKMSTTISGGLVLTGKIICGSGEETAGMQGISGSQYSFFAGSATLSDNMPVYIKKTGEAKFGKLKIEAPNGDLTFIGTDFKINNSDLNLNAFNNDLGATQVISGSRNIDFRINNWNNAMGGEVIIKGSFSASGSVTTYYALSNDSNPTHQTYTGSTPTSGSNINRRISVSPGYSYMFFRVEASTSISSCTINSVTIINTAFEKGFNIYNNAILMASSNKYYAILFAVKNDGFFCKKIINTSTSSQIIDIFE